jgi:FkbM family methyltransferase
MTQRLRDKLEFYSQIKYFLWRMLSPFHSYDLTVKMKSGINIIIRPSTESGHGNFSDLCIGYEIFVGEPYKLPKEIRLENVAHIIDIGGNVGYSCLYWLSKFPNSHVVVIEPHPKHIEKIYDHLKINQYEERVLVIASAAGSKVGSLFLTDMGAESKLTNEQSENTISVPVIDWFETVRTQDIDILKIDIEGGEYSLLSDPRFADLKCKAMVIEWHNTSMYPDGQKWCIDKLKHLNYKVIPTIDFGDCGIIWAFA